jgi:hypothetical protein
LFNAATNSPDIKKVLLQVKIIATENLDIINDIVRGTNRQNIVLDEAFETTRKFHKDLEEFFNVMPVSGNRVHYERRSRQYQYDPRIKQTDKINLRILTQFFVGMFLNMPHMSHRHEARLLKEWEGKIYLEEQSKLPYFTTALTFVKLEDLCRQGKIEKGFFYSFRAHLTMLFRQIIAGHVPSVNSEKAIDAHSKKVLEVLGNHKETEIVFGKCVEVFSECQRQWTGPMKRSVFGMKDISEFTSLLLSKTREQPASAENPEGVDDKFRGRVVKVILDRYSRQCGFIARASGNMFFHSSENRDLDFDELVGVMVSYRIAKNRKGEDMAIDVAREE